METRRLGDSDLEITRIGFGAWGVGGGGWAGGYGPQDDAESIAAIHRALDLGVNWIDTAAIYGVGRSEQVVGRALAGLAERPYVFTKCSLVRNEAHEVVTDLRAASIRQECEDSLRRLGVEAIDLYQVHWPEPDLGGSLEEALGVLVELQREGKVRHLGGSNFELGHVRRAQAIGPLVALQPAYSLLARDAGRELLPACREDGIGVIVYSPMASGLLSGSFSRERAAALPEDDWRRGDERFQEPKLSRSLAVADGVARVAERLGRPPGQVAIAWTLAHPAVTGAIVGFRRPQHVDDLVGAADLALSPADVEELSALAPADGG
jgi:aryl-alcohol dehydrogenase-like predicted oxidoreductase